VILLFDKGSGLLTVLTMDNRLLPSEKSIYRTKLGLNPTNVHRVLVALGVLLIGLLGAGRAVAQNTTWVVGTGDFQTGSNWNNGGPANAFWFINNGGTAQQSSEFGTFASNGYLGYNATDSGNLEILTGGFITGGDSNLAVGFDGSGTFAIASGGSLAHKGLFIAARTGSAGTVNINSGELSLTDIIHVGYGGSGSLTLSGNGTITSDKADIGGFTTATGTATITNGLWQNTNALFVGVEGNGTLAVAAQGTVTSESLFVGQSTGGSGSVTVSGGNVTLTNTLAVGVRGTGNLDVTSGGLVSADFVQVGLESGSSGTATVTGNSTLTATNYVQVGVTSGSSGTLNLSGTLNTPNITVAQESGSTGVLNVTGTNLQTTQLVGGNGSATVNLNDGTALNAGFAGGDLTISGFSAGEFNLSGNVTFNDEGFTIQVNSPLSGTGHLIKTGGGNLNLTAASTYSGGTVIQEGYVNVSHPNAFGTGNITNNGILQSTANLTIGSETPLIIVEANQFGAFAPQAGTTLTLAPGSFELGANATFYAGFFTGTNATVVFAPDAATAVQPGTGEVQAYYGTLRAGNAQLAALTAQAGSTTVWSDTTLDFQDHLAGGGIRNLQGNGTVHIGSNASTTLAVNSGNFSGTITGAGGLVKTSSDTLILSGFSEFTGGTTIDEGVLIVNGALLTGLGTVEVNAGGTLGGTGDVGPVTLNGGSISPGNSPGTFFPTEILWYDGLILFELGPTQNTSDFINTGKLQGLGSTYKFTFVDQGMVNGMTYDLISFDPTLATAIPIGNFTFTNGRGINGTFGYRSESASTSYLQFTVIPEPATWALLVLAVVFLGARIMRRGASL
jgi:T5SS/PEP-CTERM-associated repeat protein/autotransporter-associated beta strand protein